MQGSAQISEPKTKRKHTTTLIRQSHVESWKRSSLSMSEYCRQKELSLSNFSGWVQTYNKSQGIFKPINVLSLRNNAEVPSNTVEIHLAQQVKIRFSNITDCTLIIKIARELAKCS
jgi:hypothetical protein